MKKALFLVAVFGAYARLYAFDFAALNDWGAGSGGLFTRSAPPPAATPAMPAAGAYEYLHMNVISQPAWGTVEASDARTAIRVSVKRAGAGQYSVTNRVGAGLQTGYVRVIMGGDYQFLGGGNSLRLTDSGGRYTLSGSVISNGHSSYLNLNVYRQDSFSFQLTGGAGVRLSVTKDSVSGNFNEDSMSKEAVAASLAIIFAAQAQNFPGASKAVPSAGN